MSEVKLPPSSRWHDKKWRYGFGAIFAGSLVLNFILIGVAVYGYGTMRQQASGIRAIAHALPEEVRDDFHNTMRAKRTAWRQEMKSMQSEISIAARQLTQELNEPDFNRKKADILVLGMQERMSRRGTRAMDDMRAILINVLAELSPEQRREVAEEIEAALDNWKPQRRRW